jgi:hypothetical protein
MATLNLALQGENWQGTGNNNNTDVSAVYGGRMGKRVNRGGVGD